MKQIEQHVGTPEFTVEDIDIMHEIDYTMYRFQPENMKPIDVEDKGRPAVVLNYQSKKSIFF